MVVPATGADGRSLTVGRLSGSGFLLAACLSTSASFAAVDGCPRDAIPAADGSDAYAAVQGANYCEGMIKADYAASLQIIGLMVPGQISNGSHLMQVSTSNRSGVDRKVMIKGIASVPGKVYRFDALATGSRPVQIDLDRDIKPGNIAVQSITFVGVLQDSVVDTLVPVYVGVVPATAGSSRFLLSVRLPDSIVGLTLEFLPIDAAAHAAQAVDLSRKIEGVVTTVLTAPMAGRYRLVMSGDLGNAATPAPIVLARQVLID